MNTGATPQPPRVAGIILAAGAATRMGRLKQLLEYHGKSLVRHAIDQASGAGFDPLIVVVGSESHAVLESLTGQPVEIAQNECWQTGMGSSIAAGVRKLLESGRTCDAVAILVVDQPLIEAWHLARMRELLRREEAAIVAAEYSGTRGVPAVFTRDLFPMLLALPPGAGARTLLRSTDVRVIPFPLPQAAVDIDTPEDLERFTSELESRRQR